MDNDTSWCPACDRQILPKRFLVPVAPPPPPAPAPPPSSPQSPAPHVRRTKVPALRQRGGGLLHGTGRVKPNGSIKRDPKPPAPAPVPTAPIKHRTVIDQGPTPLYCSDECQMADIHNSFGVLPLDHNPDRQPISPEGVAFARPDLESDSAGSSIESQSSLSSTSSTAQQSATMSPSLATLAAIYHFPPLPPPAPVDENTSTHVDCGPQEYTSGVMMAARRIADMCPKPQKRNAYGHILPPDEPRKPIPGWTDGSNAWRSTIYNFTSPRQPAGDDAKAYTSFSASSHRSRGVHSTVGSSSYPVASRSTASLPNDTSELISNFSQSFNRRSQSRVSLFPASSSPSRDSFPSTAPAPHKRERSLLMPGAEGKLLVPEVKLKVHSGSSGSLSSAWSSPSSPKRSTVRSPLSLPSACESGEEDPILGCGSAPSPSRSTKRPVVEARSWSYDNVKTYPLMPAPPKMEKRMEKRIVDGLEVEVEVEVEVEEPRKRLFHFSAPVRA